MEQIDIAILRFEEPLSQEEVRWFRSAIVELTGRDDTWFHNHPATGGLAYRYPLIQYKTLDGRACIVGMGEAAQSVLRLRENFPCELQVGKSKRPFHVQECNLKSYWPKLETCPKLYSIRNYIALTEDNFKKYHSMLALTDKITLLEHILVGNILSFMKGIGYYSKEQIFCAVTDMDRLHSQMYKGVRFDTFDLSFVSNAELPAFISLGKSASVGFGVLTQEALPEKFKNFGQQS